MPGRAYEDLTFKIPRESDDYMECSDFVVDAVESIMKDAMDQGRNKIIINTYIMSQGRIVVLGNSAGW